MVTTSIQPRMQSEHIFLAASVLIHALLLCIPLASPVIQKNETPQNRLFAVELLIPEQEGAESQNVKPQDPAPTLHAPPFTKSVETDPTERLPRPLPEPKIREPREATVSLDRMSEDTAQYRSYIDHLRSKIGAVWEYPPAAREKGINGLVTVRFSIDSGGRMTALNVIKTSKHRLLDDEALRTINTAAPFSPFPGEFSIATLHVLATFEYEFSDH